MAGIGVLVFFISCTKEFSLENGGNVTSNLIVGTDCRISKIDYQDSSSGFPLGSIAATINANDTVTDITLFDSLSNTIAINSMPQYGADTIYIDSDEYFLVDAVTKNIIHLHGILTSTFPTIPFEADYIYDGNGNLIQKVYSIPGTSPAVQVDYTYTAGNLTHMTFTDETIGQLISDADIDYYSNITPRNYLNLMPDEGLSGDFNHFAPYTQFFNFGKKPVNAIKKMTVRDYSGGVVADSTVSTFTTYSMSLDNYVQSVYMLGDDQESIPAAEGKLVFSYKCK